MYVPSHNNWNIVECDVKQQINKPSPFSELAHTPIVETSFPEIAVSFLF